MDDLGTAFSAKRPRSRPRPRPAEDSQLDMHLVNNIKDMVSRRYPANIDDMGIVALLYLFLTLKAQDDGLPSTDDLGLDMTVTSQIPIGAGLGSSAAFSVAVAAAFYKHSINQDLELINNNNNNTCTCMHMCVQSHMNLTFFLPFQPFPPFHDTEPETTSRRMIMKPLAMMVLMMTTATMDSARSRCLNKN